MLSLPVGYNFINGKYNSLSIRDKCRLVMFNKGCKNIFEKHAITVSSEDLSKSKPKKNVSFKERVAVRLIPTKEEYKATKLTGEEQKTMICIDFPEEEKLHEFEGLLVLFLRLIGLWESRQPPKKLTEAMWWQPQEFKAMELDAVEEAKKYRKEELVKGRELDIKAAWKELYEPVQIKRADRLTKRDQVAAWHEFYGMEELD